MTDFIGYNQNTMRSWPKPFSLVCVTCSYNINVSIISVKYDLLHFLF